MPNELEPRDLPPKGKVVDVTPDDTGFISLPYSQQEFTEFISSLLGKQQTVSKTIYGAFSINLDNLSDVYHRVSQRMAQQNRSRLISFSAQISFSDNSSVVLNAYEDLVAYRETRPLISTGVNLSWSYLVQFEDKSAPEKQEILLSIISSLGSQVRFDNNIAFPTLFTFGRLVDFFPESKSRRNSVGFGYFNIEIKHTARTWAVDMEGLLSDFAESEIPRGEPLKAFAKRHASVIGGLTGLVFFLTASATAFFRFNAYIFRADLAGRAILNDASTTLADKLNYILQTLTIDSNQTSKVVLTTMMTFILSLFAGSGIIAPWIKFLASSHSPSFVLLTRASKAHKEDIEKKLERRWLWFIISFVIGVFSGLLTNLIWLWLVD